VLEWWVRRPGKQATSQKPSRGSAGLGSWWIQELSAALAAGSSIIPAVIRLRLAVGFRVACGRAGGRTELVGDGRESRGGSVDDESVISWAVITSIGDRSCNQRHRSNANVRREVWRSDGAITRSIQSLIKTGHAGVINDAIKGVEGLCVRVRDAGSSGITGNSCRDGGRSACGRGSRQVGSRLNAHAIADVGCDGDTDVGQRAKRGIELWN